MKVSELSGALLDYWVAQAEGQLRMIAGTIEEKLGGYSPSTKWVHGGPIIERARISIGLKLPLVTTWDAHLDVGAQWLDGETFYGKGDTPLIAAMRAYVASKFGDEVPDEEAA